MFLKIDRGAVCDDLRCTKQSKHFAGIHKNQDMIQTIFFGQPDICSNITMFPLVTSPPRGVVKPRPPGTPPTPAREFCRHMPAGHMPYFQDYASGGHPLPRPFPGWGAAHAWSGAKLHAHSHNPKLRA